MYLDVGLRKCEQQESEGELTCATTSEEKRETRGHIQVGARLRGRKGECECVEQFSVE